MTTWYRLTAKIITNECFPPGSFRVPAVFLGGEKAKAQNALIHVKGEIVYDRHIAQKIAMAFVTIWRYHRDQLFLVHIMPEIDPSI